MFKVLPRLLGRLRKQDLLAGLVQGAGVAFAIQVAGLGVSYLVQVLLARWMGPVEYGKYAYTTAWVVVLSVPAVLGFDLAVLRFVPEYRTKGEWARLWGFVIRSRWLVFVVGVVLALLGTGISLWLSRKGFEYAMPLALGMWMVPFTALLKVQIGLFRALHRVVLAYAPGLLIRPLLLALLAYWFTLEKKGLSGIQAIGAAVFALLLVVLAQHFFLMRDLKRAIPPARPVFETRKWLSVAFPLSLTLGFLVVMNQSDLLMVGVFLGAKEAALYYTAVKTAALVGFVINAVNALAAPTFAALYSSNRRSELQSLLTKLAHWIFWPSLGIGFLLVVLAPLILGLFGPEFVEARWAMLVLVIGQLVNAGAGSVGYLLELTGYQVHSVRVRAYGVAVNITLNFLLIPIFGIFGAALATTFSLILWNIWMHSLVQRFLGVHPSIVSAFVLGGRSKAI